MKKGISSNIPSSVMSGKSILIISVIFISTLSFSLGYLVGKRSDSYSERSLIETKREPLIKEKPAPDEFDRRVEKIIKQDISRSKKTRQEEKEEIVRPDNREKHAKYSGPLYSIQVGAFKKRTDAERLKKRLEKSGFKSYIVTVKLSKGELFKVRAGKFENRHEAERNASKIKKMKGLDAFVLLEK